MARGPAAAGGGESARRAGGPARGGGAPISSARPWPGGEGTGGEAESSSSDLSGAPRALPALCGVAPTAERAGCRCRLAPDAGQLVSAGRRRSGPPVGEGAAEGSGQGEGGQRSRAGGFPFLKAALDGVSPAAEQSLGSLLLLLVSSCWMKRWGRVCVANGRYVLCPLPGRLLKRGAKYVLAGLAVCIRYWILRR